MDRLFTYTTHVEVPSTFLVDARSAGRYVSTVSVNPWNGRVVYRFPRHEGTLRAYSEFVRGLVETGMVQDLAYTPEVFDTFSIDGD